jgi:hypothetical protein
MEEKQKEQQSESYKLKKRRLSNRIFKRSLKGIQGAYTLGKKLAIFHEI